MERNTGGIIWLTGLPASGKSTIANEIEKILITNKMAYEMLDGDKVREIFPHTGFSKDERNAHIEKMGFTAALLAKHNILVVASFVSPYEKSRNFVRKICPNFFEVYVSTPLETCIKRDPKGHYAKAKAGTIKFFTGITDPYEVPKKPEMIITTHEDSAHSIAHNIFTNFMNTFFNRL